MKFDSFSKCIIKNILILTIYAIKIYMKKYKNYYYHVIRPSKHIELEEDISINKNKLLKTKKFY